MMPLNAAPIEVLSTHMEPYNVSANEGILVDTLEYDFMGILNSVLSDLTLDTGSNTGSEPRIIGQFLNYPNPFRYHDGTELHYTLNVDADLELRIYNLLAREVCQIDFKSSYHGGSAGKNVVQLTPHDFGHSTLPSGLYMSLLIHSNRVIAKGKMVIKP